MARRFSVQKCKQSRIVCSRAEIDSSIRPVLIDRSRAWLAEGVRFGNIVHVVKIEKGDQQNLGTGCLQALHELLIYQRIATNRRRNKVATIDRLLCCYGNRANNRTRPTDSGGHETQVTNIMEQKQKQNPSPPMPL